MLTELAKLWSNLNSVREELNIFQCPDTMKLVKAVEKKNEVDLYVLMWEDSHGSTLTLSVERAYFWKICCCVMYPSMNETFHPSEKLFKKEVRDSN